MAGTSGYKRLSTDWTLILTSVGWILPDKQINVAYFPLRAADRNGSLLLFLLLTSMATNSFWSMGTKISLLMVDWILILEL